jgi:uncharacterized ferritin-like protein (DUF455 family)
VTTQTQPVVPDTANRSLRARCLAALATGDVDQKLAAVEALTQDTGATDPEEVLREPPALPGRPPRPVLVSPKDVPQRALGSVDGRAALLHALAHIEFNAIKTVYNECQSTL